jgi:hypothetical protein
MVGGALLRDGAEIKFRQLQTRMPADCPFSLRLRDRSAAGDSIPNRFASSTGRCNTSVKSLRWGFECQSLVRSFVELTRHFVQVSLRIQRQVGPLREVLLQQAIGIFIGTALPRTLRIAEVNVDVGR